eukprot:gb/GECH01013696.1/.p1 GENE.gb/GECH01013696.1/~~gb/GECH01013696.1/.p1  ORF type:complete len:2575 (+),score=462.53 gb/GECH01013696.1/:1-7725(+)
MLGSHINWGHQDVRASSWPREPYYRDHPYQDDHTVSSCWTYNSYHKKEDEYHDNSSSNTDTTITHFQEIYSSDSDLTVGPKHRPLYQHHEKQFATSYPSPLNPMTIAPPPPPSPVLSSSPTPPSPLVNGSPQQWNEHPPHRGVHPGQEAGPSSHRDDTTRYRLPTIMTPSPGKVVGSSASQDPPRPRALSADDTRPSSMPQHISCLFHGCGYRSDEFLSSLSLPTPLDKSSSLSSSSSSVVTASSCSLSSSYSSVSPSSPPIPTAKPSPRSSSSLSSSSSLQQRPEHIGTYRFLDNIPFLIINSKNIIISKHFDKNEFSSNTKKAKVKDIQKEHPDIEIMDFTQTLTFSTCFEPKETNIVTPQNFLQDINSLLSNVEPTQNQVQSFLESIHHNLLIHMPTGAGKTLAGAMLLKWMRNHNKPQPGIFLVTRVPLCFQQADAITQMTGLRTAVIVGETWWRQREEAFNNLRNDVFCMTADLFVNLIEKNSLDLGMFSSIVLDEAHHTISPNHAYYRLAEFYSHYSRDSKMLPRIVAMTATPSQQKKGQNIASLIQELIQKFNTLHVSNVKYEINKEIMESVEKLEHTPQQSNILSSMSTIILQLTCSLSNKANNLLNSGKSLTRQKLKDIFSEIQTNNPSEELIENLSILHDSFVFYPILGARKIIDRFPDILSDHDWLSFGGLITDRIRNIIFNSNNKSNDDNDSIRVIIFVQEQKEAKLIFDLFKQDRNMEELSPAFIVGQRGNYGMSWQEQQNILEDFRKGNHQILISTSVLQEGIDVPKCNQVICVDPILDFVSLVQLRGRIRSEGSFHVLLFKKSVEDLEKAREQEKKMYDALAMESKEFLSEEQIEIIHRYNTSPSTFSNNNLLPQNHVISIKRNRPGDNNNWLSEINRVIDDSESKILHFEQHSNREGLVEIQSSDTKNTWKTMEELNHLIPDAVFYIHDNREEWVDKISIESLQLDQYFEELNMGVLLENNIFVSNEPRNISSNNCYLEIKENREFSFQCIREDKLHTKGKFNKTIIDLENWEHGVLYILVESIKFNKDALLSNFEKDLMQYDGFTLAIKFRKPIKDILYYDYLSHPKIENLRYQFTRIQHNLWFPVDLNLQEMTFPQKFTFHMILQRIPEYRFNLEKFNRLQNEIKQYDQMEDLKSLQLKYVDGESSGASLIQNYCYIPKLRITSRRIIFKRFEIFMDSFASRYIVSNVGDVVSIEFENNSVFIDHLSSDRFPLFEKFRYEFLVYQKLKPPQAFFVETNVNYREKIGSDIQSILKEKKDPGRYLARIHQLFSSGKLIEIETSEMTEWNQDLLEPIEDKCTANGSILTDGIGFCSQSLAELIWQKLWPKSENNQIEINKPTAFQIRIGGMKGVIQIDPHMEKPVRFFKSMEKFKLNQLYITVLNHAQELDLKLNKQVIIALEQRGIPRKNFLILQRKFLDNMNETLTKPKLAKRCTSKIMERYFDISSKSFRLGKDSIFHSVLSEPFFRKILFDKYNRAVKQVQDKCNIKISNGALLMGVLDPTKKLSPGRVYVHLSSRDDPLPDGTQVVLWRNPVVRKDDIVLAEIQNIPELDSVAQNCVVFPSTGNEPLFSQCSGGDLDGDLYAVTWDKLLIPPDSISKKSISENIKYGTYCNESVSKFLTEFLEQDKLGKIAYTHQHVSINDGMDSKNALILAEMFNTQVDSVKQGKYLDYAETFGSNTEKTINNLMENYGTEEAIDYSNSAISMLQQESRYLNCDKSVSQFRNSSYFEFLKNNIQKFEHYISNAEKDYKHFVCQMKDLLDHFDETEEDAIFSELSNEKKRLFEYWSDIIFQGYKMIFEREMKGKSDEEFLNKARAWYYVCHNLEHDERFLSFGFINAIHIINNESRQSKLDLYPHRYNDWPEQSWSLMEFSMKQHQKRKEYWENATVLTKEIETITRTYGQNSFKLFISGKTLCLLQEETIELYTDTRDMENLAKILSKLGKISRKKSTVTDTYIKDDRIYIHNRIDYHKRSFKLFQQLESHPHLFLAIDFLIYWLKSIKFYSKFYQDSVDIGITILEHIFNEIELISDSNIHIELDRFQNLWKKLEQLEKDDYNLAVKKIENFFSDSENSIFNEKNTNDDKNFLRKLSGYAYQARHSLNLLHHNLEMFLSSLSSERLIPCNKIFSRFVKKRPKYFEKSIQIKFDLNQVKIEDASLSSSQRKSNRSLTKTKHKTLMRINGPLENVEKAAVFIASCDPSKYPHYGEENFSRKATSYLFESCIDFSSRIAMKRYLNQRHAQHEHRVCFKPILQDVNPFTGENHCRKMLFSIFKEKFNEFVTNDNITVTVRFGYEYIIDGQKLPLDRNRSCRISELMEHVNFPSLRNNKLSFGARSSFFSSVPYSYDSMINLLKGNEFEPEEGQTYYSIGSEHIKTHTSSFSYWTLKDDQLVFLNEKYHDKRIVCVPIIRNKDPNHRIDARFYVNQENPVHDLIFENEDEKRNQNNNSQKCLIHLGAEYPQFTVNTQVEENHHLRVFIVRTVKQRVWKDQCGNKITVRQVKDYSLRSGNTMTPIRHEPHVEFSGSFDFKEENNRRITCETFTERVWKLYLELYKLIN